MHDPHELSQDLQLLLEVSKYWLDEHVERHVFDGDKTGRDGGHDVHWSNDPEHVAQSG